MCEPDEAAEAAIAAAKPGPASRSPYHQPDEHLLTRPKDKSPPNNGGRPESYDPMDDCDYFAITSR